MPDFEVKAITNKYCEELIDIANLTPFFYKDRPNSFPLEKKTSCYASGSTMIFLKEEKFKEFKFEVNDGDTNKTQNDLHNSRVLYNALVYRDMEGKESLLTPLQASDRRIWNFLAHHELFWRYINNRWGGANPNIKKRFILININGSSLVRHALSRLWWYSELCYDNENRKDPLDLLNVLCTNSDVLYSLSDRAYSANRKVIQAILKFLIKPENKELLKAEKIKEVAKILTTETGIRDLPMLDTKELEEVFNNILKT